MLRIAAPLAVPDEVFNLRDLDAVIHQGDWLLKGSFNDHPLLDDARYFAASYAGDFLAWRRPDLSPNSEAPIYVIPRNANYGIQLIALGFDDLVNNVVAGDLPEPLGHLQSNDPPRRSTFVRAYTTG